MERFESNITPEGESNIHLLDSDVQFLLDSERGWIFAVEFIELYKAHYPTSILAAEQMEKLKNKSLYALMKTNHRLYITHIAHRILYCCFGENDQEADYNGREFVMEYPRGCRDRKTCPWCGYADRNKDSFMVICGAKREWGFTPQERRIAKMIQAGASSVGGMAEVTQTSVSNITNTLTRIYKRTLASNMLELVHIFGKHNL